MKIAYHMMTSRMPKSMPAVDYVLVPFERCAKAEVRTDEPSG